MNEFMTQLFFPLLHPIFSPVNEWLAAVYLPWAKICALGLFFGTMAWVYLGLKKEYVNLDAPGKRFYHDLRLWTVVSMSPHVVVYLYF